MPDPCLPFNKSLIKVIGIGIVAVEQILIPAMYTIYVLKSTYSSASLACYTRNNCIGYCINLGVIIIHGFPFCVPPPASVPSCCHLYRTDNIPDPD